MREKIDRVIFEMHTVAQLVFISFSCTAKINAELWQPVYWLIPSAVFSRNLSLEGHWKSARIGSMARVCLVEQSRKRDLADEKPLESRAEKRRARFRERRSMARKSSQEPLRISVCSEGSTHAHKDHMAPEGMEGPWGWSIDDWLARLAWKLNENHSHGRVRANRSGTVGAEHSTQRCTKDTFVIYRLS